MPRKEPAVGVLGSHLPVPASGVAGSLSGWAIGPTKPGVTPEGAGTGLSLPPAWTIKLAADALLTPPTALPLWSHPGLLWEHLELTTWGPCAQGPCSRGSPLPGTPTGTKMLTELGGHTDGSVLGQGAPTCGTQGGSLPLG